MKYILLSIIILFTLSGCGSSSSNDDTDINTSNNGVIGTYLPNATIDNIKLSKDNQTAYLLEHGNLIILDINNPSTPKLLSDNKISEFPIRDIAISNNDKRIYIGVDSKVIILDISDKKNPKQVTTYQNIAINLSIELSSDNSMLYLATTPAHSGEQFFVLDLHDEDNIVELGRQKTIEYASGVDLAISPDNTKAYVANKYWGLGIIDISDAQNLTLLTLKYIERKVHSVALSNDGLEAYTVTGVNGFTILDISDSNDIRIKGNYESNRTYISKIIPSKDGTKLYILKDGLKILDITDVSQPTLLTNFTIKYPRGMAISSDESKAYIVKAGYSEDNTSTGLVILDLNYFKNL